MGEMATVPQGMRALVRKWTLTFAEKALLRPIDNLFVRYSLIGDAPFFEPEQFSWVTDLEASWRLIRAELDEVLKYRDQLPNFQDISPDQYNLTHDDRWKTFFLYGFGLKHASNCARCPDTARLIEAIPGMTTAFFSILLPHKRIPEHSGVYRGVVRYHLALKIPQPNTSCGIQVGGETRHWQEGKSLIFDDRYPHHAWNDSDEVRVVLFLDFMRPLRSPISLLNQLTVKAISLSPYVQAGKDNMEQWEPLFEKLFDTKEGPKS